MPRKSIGIYPDNWDESAELVKDKAGWQCIRCNYPHNPAAGYTLTVHHLDLNKSNCAWWNLAALCQRCHLQIQNKVVMERRWMFEHSEWFRPYVAGFYAHKYGLPESKQYVLSHLADLLMLEKSWSSASAGWSMEKQRVGA